MEQPGSCRKMFPEGGVMMMGNPNKNDCLFGATHPLKAILQVNAHASIQANARPSQCADDGIPQQHPHLIFHTLHAAPNKRVWQPLAYGLVFELMGVPDIRKIHCRTLNQQLSWEKFKQFRRQTKNI